MRPGKFRSCQRAVSRQNLRAGNSQSTRFERDRLLQIILFDSLRLRPALFSLGLGLPLSFAATRIYQSMLSGTKPLDPVVLSRVLATLETSCDPGSYGR